MALFKLWMSNTISSYIIIIRFGFSIKMEFIRLSAKSSTSLSFEKVD